MKPFTEWTTAELEARFDILATKAEFATDMTPAYFDLLDEVTALSCILARRHGKQCFTVTQDHPPIFDAPYAVYSDEPDGAAVN